jgi:ABC-type transporter MlaC component
MTITAPAVTVPNTAINPAAKIGTVAAEAVKAFAEAKAAEAAAKAAKAAAEKIIREALGEATSGTFRGQTIVRLQSSSNSTLDRETIKTAFPEAYAAALRVTEYDFIKVV